MEVILIGAGNVACSLGPALKEAGHRIAAVSSRTGLSARELAGKLDSVAVEGIRPLAPFSNGSGQPSVCITMLADDVLKAAAGEIVETLGPDTLYLHTAGSVAMDVWRDAGACRYGVFYPMTSFSRNCPVSMRHVPLFVEADSDGSLAAVLELARSISDSVKELDSQGRLFLHLAAVFANNFPCRMMAISQLLLERHGIGFEVMLPLVKGAVDKLEHMTPLESQTGPAARGDIQVLEHHMEMLAGDPEWQTLYKLISKDINPNILTDD